MKKFLPVFTIAACAICTHAQTTEIIQIDGAQQEFVKLAERSIGPGTVYTRYRMPGFPLNINLVRVDLTNPHIRIETSIPNDRSAGTELLVNAAKRYDAPQHHAICAQNSNFWIVSTQPQWAAYNASTHNVSMRNGMLSIDSKSFPHWWWWTTERSGIVSITDNNELFIDLCRTEMTFRSDKLGTRNFDSCNKGFKTGQTAIYTPYFGADRQFLPLIDDTPEQIAQNDIHYDVNEGGKCTEVLLDIADGETWSGGRDIKFIVAQVRSSNGRGTLGDHSLAIVSYGDDLAALTAGDIVTLNYTWVFDPDGAATRPTVTQAVGGNMMVMRNGVITEQDKWDSYNTMVYSRSAYGSSADNKTLYMVTIDKSTDPVYGASAGCTTDQMCQILRHLGCSNLINVDAGGSAELMVEGHIINTTTEGTPRAVGNGWMVFNTAPDDETEVATIAFYDVTLQVAAGALYSPRVIAYNRYGTVISDNYTDYTLTCDATVGNGNGNALQATGNAASGTVTATLSNGFSITKDITVIEATPAMRVKTIVVDETHPYTLEVEASVDGKTFSYNPTIQKWEVADQTIARVDADGVLHAVSNGVTTLTGTFGNTSETVTVLSQTATDKTMPLDNEAFEGWTAKGNTGLSKFTLATDGTVSYTYGSPRSVATITVAKAITVFGMPERIHVYFESDIPLTHTEIDLRKAGDRRGSITSKPEGGYEAGKEHCATFEVSALGNVNDRILYPLSFAGIKFHAEVKSEFKGEHTLKIKRIEAEYGAGGGVNTISIPSVSALILSQNSVNAGDIVTVMSPGIRSLQVYNLSGIAVAHGATGTDAATFAAPAVPGIYIVRAVTDAGTASARLLVH